MKEIPSAKDTIAKRYVQAVIGGVLQMVTFLYALILLRFDIKWFFVSPLLIGLAFLIGNTTSSLSLTLLFGSIAAVPWGCPLPDADAGQSGDSRAPASRRLFRLGTQCHLCGRD